jgi:hypothetical protein
MPVNLWLHRRKVKTHRRQCKKASSKKIGLLKDFAAGVYLSEAQNPIPPPPLTHCICVYSILLFTQGRRERGRVEPERRGKGQQFTKLGRKYQNEK